jgi:hypothetical protein
VACYFCLSASSAASDNSVRWRRKVRRSEFDSLWIVRSVETTEGNVVGDGELVALDVLKDRLDPASPNRQAAPKQVDAADTDRPRWGEV